MVFGAHVFVNSVFARQFGVGERSGRVVRGGFGFDRDDHGRGCVFVLRDYIERTGLGAAYPFDVHLLLGSRAVHVRSLAVRRTSVRDDGAGSRNVRVARVRARRGWFRSLVCAGNMFVVCVHCVSYLFGRRPVVSTDVLLVFVGCRVRDDVDEPSRGPVGNALCDAVCPHASGAVHVFALRSGISSRGHWWGDFQIIR